MAASDRVLRVDLAQAGWEGLLEHAGGARREGAGALVVVASGAGHGRAEDAVVAKALALLGRLDVPAVAALGGVCDESALALAVVCSLTFAGPDLQIDVALDRAGTAGLLEHALPWQLAARIGPAWARDLLLGAQPLASARLAACGLATESLDPDGAATAAADRLAAAPGASLIVRSLRVAERSTALQSADYDRELLALLAGLGN